MKKTIEKIRDLPLALFVGASASMMASQAQAAGERTVGAAASNLLGQASPVGQVLLALFALGGITMFATGFFKLKQASENPQTKYSEGAWRIAVGAGLCAIPAVAAMMTGSLGLGEVGKMTVQGGAAF